jgi:hypothetical protein
VTGVIRDILIFGLFVVIVLWLMTGPSEKSQSVAVVAPDSNCSERMREAEERISSLEIQVSLLAEGERKRAALLHGFETIGR